MFRRVGNPPSEIQFTIGHDSLANFSRVEAKPHQSIGITSIVSGAVGVDTIGLQEQIVLSEFGIVAGFVNRVGFAAEFANYRKTWHIAGAVRDVDHILKRYSTILMGHLGIYIDAMVFVGTLIVSNKALVLVVLSTIIPI